MRRHAFYCLLGVGLALATASTAAAMDALSQWQPGLMYVSQQPAYASDAAECQEPYACDASMADQCGYAVCEQTGGSGCGPRCGAGCGSCRKPPVFFDAWVAQGFTGNPDHPNDNFNGPVTFNDRANEYQMNQLYLAFGRRVDAARHAWDIGGRVDLLYGTDYFFTTAAGLETRIDGSPKWNSSIGPRGTGAAMYGLAMPQLYAEVFAPIGNGMTVKMGHFYTIIGHESVMAPENFFYSHSYSMQYGEPFTHTGLLATYHATPSLELHAGFTRGWDTWEDPNNDLGALAGVTWTSPDKWTSLSLAVHTGNEDPAGQRNRTMYSLVFSRYVTDRLKYVFQHDLGTEDNAATLGNSRVDGNWYSINQYLIYQLNCTTSLGLRVEWFRDENSTRVFNAPADVVQGSNYTELTLGMNWKPLEQVVVRPELRWDWSDVRAPSIGATGMFDDFTKRNQFLLGLDVIVRR